MMKRLFILLFISLLMFGCVEKVQVDWNVGVRYILESEEKSGHVTIYLDPNQKDVIATIFITYHQANGLLDAELTDLMMNENGDNYQDSRDEKTVYVYKRSKAVVSYL